MNMDSILSLVAGMVQQLFLPSLPQESGNGLPPIRRVSGVSLDMDCD
jgi:hypothetical protein